MSISAVSTSSNINSANPFQTWRTFIQQKKQDISDIGTALKSGDLSSAQKAFSDLQSLSSATQGQVKTASKKSSVPDDFASLDQALQSGSLSDAQAAYTKLQTDIQAQAGGHHHRHHASENSSSTNSRQGDLAGEFSALGQALQSGSLGDAQTAFTKLMTDLKNKRGGYYNQQGGSTSTSTGTNAASTVSSVA